MSVPVGVVGGLIWHGTVYKPKTYPLGSLGGCGVNSGMVQYINPKRTLLGRLEVAE